MFIILKKKINNSKNHNNKIHFNQGELTKTNNKTQLLLVIKAKSHFK